MMFGYDLRAAIDYVIYGSRCEYIKGRLSLNATLSCCISARPRVECISFLFFTSFPGSMHTAHISIARRDGNLLLIEPFLFNFLLLLLCSLCLIMEEQNVLVESWRCRDGLI